MNRILQIHNKIHEYKINNELYTVIKWIISMIFIDTLLLTFIVKFIVKNFIIYIK